MSGAEQQGERATPHEEPLTFYTRVGQQAVQREKERFIKKVEEALAASPNDVALQEILAEQRAELEVIKSAPVEVDITHFNTMADRERAVTEVKEQIYELRQQAPSVVRDTMIAVAQRLKETYERMPIGRAQE